MQVGYRLKKKKRSKWRPLRKQGKPSQTHAKHIVAGSSFLARRGREEGSTLGSKEGRKEGGKKVRKQGSTEVRK